MKNEQQYDWDWAEKADESAVEDARLTVLKKEYPYLPVLTSIFFDKPNLRDTIIPPPHAIAPDSQTEIPEGFNALTCAFCNPNAKNSFEWTQKILSAPEYSNSNQIENALHHMQRIFGTIHSLSPASLAICLDTLSKQSDPCHNDFLNNAFVKLFQPSDMTPAHAEDLPYAPLCRILLEKGKVLAEYRDENGFSALSGINKLLIESSIGMANQDCISDLLTCAELILDHGAPSDSVREMPPISKIIGNEALRNLLTSCDEKRAIRLSLENSPAFAKQEPPLDDRRSKRL